MQNDKMTSNDKPGNKIRIVSGLTVKSALASALLTISVKTYGIERFPPPDFTTSGHKLPIAAVPPARAEWFTYLDISILIIALFLATYFAIWRRSRRGTAGLAIFSLLYFGFYRQGCICSIGAIQNVALSIADKDYALPVAAGIFFILPLVFALFAGRVFCSAVCPLGAVQELSLMRPIKVPQWLEHMLGIIPWIYLGAALLYAATGSAFLICRYDPFVAFFRLSGQTGVLIFGATFLILSVFIGRPYCRFLCPYGALLRLLSPLAKWRVSITPNECVQCKLCEDACPYGQIKYPTPTTGKINRHEGKGRLTMLLLTLPVFIVVGAYLGHYASGSISQLDPTIRQARVVWNSEHSKAIDDVPFEVQALRKTGLPSAAVYSRALEITTRFEMGSAIFGGWIGLVIGLKLIGLSIRRRRNDYEADSSGCVACGRCYWYCPVERASHGDTEAIKILEESEHAANS